jgi:hypothetical protein
LEVARLNVYATELVYRLTETFPNALAGRSKTHHLMHCSEQIQMFGSMKNCDTSRFETMNKVTRSYILGSNNWNDGGAAIKGYAHFKFSNFLLDCGFWTKQSECGKIQIHQRGFGLDEVIEFSKKQYFNDTIYHGKSDTDIFVVNSSGSKSTYVKLKHSSQFIEPGDIVSYSDGVTIHFGKFIEAVLDGTDYSFKLYRCLLEEKSPESYVYVENEVLWVHESRMNKLESVRHDCVYERCAVVQNGNAPVISHKNEGKVFILNMLKHE